MLTEKHGTHQFTGVQASRLLVALQNSLAVGLCLESGRAGRLRSQLITRWGAAIVTYSEELDQDQASYKASNVGGVRNSTLL
jgi:hypothetical protein